MRYAYDEENDKMEVSFSGQRAKCRDCHSLVIGRKGSFKIKHWYHKTKNDCDSWYEPITEWHLKWQNLFPEEFREVVIKNNGNEKFHRADIRLKNGLVIEVQNSPINIDEISERENFYGKKNMIWILNGKSLANKSKINYQFNQKRFALFFSIPAYSDLVTNYDMDEFKSALWETETFMQIKNDKDLLDFEMNNGNYFKFEFKVDKEFSQFDYELNYLFKKISDELYGYGTYQKLISEFDVTYISVKKDNYTKVDLEKKYWRKFIDFMTFPVFIDNLNGLGTELIYWYQENRIIKRSDFINKYLKYT